jgi:hypothetical protein
VRYAETNGLPEARNGTSLVAWLIRVSVGALVHLCQAHQHFADVVDGRVVVWATAESSR